jgi:ribosome recycling factor
MSTHSPRDDDDNNIDFTSAWLGLAPAAPIEDRRVTGMTTGELRQELQRREQAEAREKKEQHAQMRRNVLSYARQLRDSDSPLSPDEVEALNRVIALFSHLPESTKK